MNADRIIQADGQSHVVRFGQYALFLMETASGKSLETFDQLSNYSAGYLMLYAGLECARVKYKTRPQAWTMEQVGDVIEAAGGMGIIQPIVLEAWFEAFPKSKVAVDALAKAGDSKNEKTQPENPAGIASSATLSNSV